MLLKQKLESTTHRSRGGVALINGQAGRRSLPGAGPGGRLRAGGAAKLLRKTQCCGPLRRSPQPLVSRAGIRARQRTVMKAGSLQSTARPRKRGLADAGAGAWGPDGAAGSVALLPAAFMSSLYQAASVLYTYASSLVPTFMLAPSLVDTCAPWVLEF